MSASIPILSCGICYEAYNHNANVPQMLTNCGHTFCASCITRILPIYSFERNTKKCPTCRTQFQVPTAIKTNYAIKDLLPQNTGSSAAPAALPGRANPVPRAPSAAQEPHRVSPSFSPRSSLDARVAASLGLAVPDDAIYVSNIPAAPNSQPDDDEFAIASALSAAEFGQTTSAGSAAGRHFESFENLGVAIDLSAAEFGQTTSAGPAAGRHFESFENLGVAIDLSRFSQNPVTSAGPAAAPIASRSPSPVFPSRPSHAQAVAQAAARANTLTSLISFGNNIMYNITRQDAENRLNGTNYRHTHIFRLEDSAVQDASYYGLSFKNGNTVEHAYMTCDARGNVVCYLRNQIILEVTGQSQKLENEAQRTRYLLKSGIVRDAMNATIGVTFKRREYVSAGLKTDGFKDFFRDMDSAEAERELRSGRCEYIFRGTHRFPSANTEANYAFSYLESGNVKHARIYLRTDGFYEIYLDGQVDPCVESHIPAFNITIRSYEEGAEYLLDQNVPYQVIREIGRHQQRNAPPFPDGFFGSR